MPGGADPLLDLVTRLLEAHGLFVYGTLMPGHERWSVIEDCVTNPMEVRVAGRLWDTGFGYPAARFEPESTAAIEGVAFDVPPARAEDLARRLLVIEGDLFDARLVRTAAGRSMTAFEWNGSTVGMRELDGRWVDSQ
jgi:gamma-glutamylcyclotransferase (GGCT)/AIG2-like uncharacterized protein YtfP